MLLKLLETIIGSIYLRLEIVKTKGDYIVNKEKLLKNIFIYGSKELTQDAFLAYVFMNAESDKFCQDFVEKLIEKAGFDKIDFSLGINIEK